MRLKDKLTNAGCFARNKRLGGKRKVSNPASRACQVHLATHRRGARVDKDGDRAEPLLTISWAGRQCLHLERPLRSNRLARQYDSKSKGIGIEKRIHPAEELRVHDFVFRVREGEGTLARPGAQSESCLVPVPVQPEAETVVRAELTRRAEVLDERGADLRRLSTRSVFLAVPSRSADSGEMHRRVRLSVQTESDVARGSGGSRVGDTHCV